MRGHVLRLARTCEEIPSGTARVFQGRASVGEREREGKSAVPTACRELWRVGRARGGATGGRSGALLVLHPTGGAGHGPHADLAERRAAPEPRATHQSRRCVAREGLCRRRSARAESRATRTTRGRGGSASIARASSSTARCSLRATGVIGTTAPFLLLLRSCWFAAAAVIDVVVVVVVVVVGKKQVSEIGLESEPMIGARRIACNFAVFDPGDAR